MVLHVFDDSFAYRGRVEHFLSLTWEEHYKGEGLFTLVAYDTDKYAALLRHGWYFYRSDRPCAMMAVKVERDTETETITVCGYTAMHLLSRRVLTLPESYTNVEAGVYAAINSKFGDFTNIATAKPKGLSAEYECTFEGVEVLSAVTDMLAESEYGLRANFDYPNKRHVFEVYDGKDLRYSAQSGGGVFAQEFGNLIHLRVTEDDDLYKNVAYVTGAANNDPSTVYYQYVAPYAGPQSNWREVVVDGEDQKEDESNPDWRKRQKQIGIKALQERKSGLTFVVEIATADFGTRFDLGDRVTCQSKRYGLRFDTQIMEYHYSITRGEEKTELVIGDKPLDYVDSEIVRKSGKK